MPTRRFNLTPAKRLKEQRVMLIPSSTRCAILVKRREKGQTANSNKIPYEFSFLS